MIVQETISIHTPGRGVIEITAELARIARAANAQTGICNIFARHTSASLIVCENADAQVLGDLEAFLTRLVPDGDRLFQHTAEGADDMPAHVRSVLTQASLSIPVAQGRLLLGTWQGVYLYEHRHRGHVRQITVTVYGD
jgi:secondary thiamine-phosphate synthase enzyme